MWLLGSKIPPIAFKHPLRNLYPEIDNGQARKLLPALRAGDKAAFKALVEGCINHALDIAGQYLAVLRSKRFIDDLTGAAMLGVHEAVDRLQRDHAIGNDKPVSYICGGIHGAVAKELENDKFIKASDKTLAKYKVPSRITSPEALEVIFESTADKSSFSNDVEDVLVGLAENELEEKVIEHRKDGYTDEETAELLGVSRATVQVIRQNLNDRFTEAAGRSSNGKVSRTTGTRPNKPS